MKHKPIFYFLLTIVLLTGCQENKKIFIDQKLLKTDWISSDNKFLFIEDSLLCTNLIDHCLPVSMYKVTDDTLTIYFRAYVNKEKSELRHYKIIDLDATGLRLKETTGNDTTIYKFKKWTHYKNNNMKIKSIDFSSNPCFGQCPVMDLKLTEDSILYLFGYLNTKHKGLYKHKLSPLELSRIQNKINTIALDSFYLAPPCPDAAIYSLFITTGNDSINISGRIHDNITLNLTNFICYMESLDYLIDLKKINNTNISFRDKFNSELYTEMKK